MASPLAWTIFRASRGCSACAALFVFVCWSAGHQP